MLKPVSCKSAVVMFESSQVITINYIEDLILEHISYFQKTISKEIETMKDEILIEMQNELYQNMNLKNNFISEKVKVEIEKFYLKSDELKDKLYEDMRKQDNNNMTAFNKLRKDVFYKDT